MQQLFLWSSGKEDASFFVLKQLANKPSPLSADKDQRAAVRRGRNWQIPKRKPSCLFEYSTDSGQLLGSLQMYQAVCFLFFLKKSFLRNLLKVVLVLTKLIYYTPLTLLNLLHFLHILQKATKTW